MDWDDVRIFLEIAREGTLGAAARKLGQTQPTMGRRLKRLEQEIGQTLFQRTSDGFVLTDEGAAVLDHAERLEEEALAFERTLAGQDKALSGLLRLSCSDWFGTYMLTPVLAEFSKLQPHITIELLTDPRLYSLPRREADLAFRIKQFDEPEVIARRLMTIPYAAYAANEIPNPQQDNLRLILMATAFGGMPDVTWAEKVLPEAEVAFRSNNREVQARMCALGMGIAILPCPLGDMTPGIRRIDLGSEPPGRDTWLGYHRDLKRLGRLRVLLDLIVEKMSN